MGSILCLPARGAVVIITFLLLFLLSRTDKCMGNGGPGLMEYSATTGRLGLGLLGLDGKVLGLGALLARDRDNQLFLGLGRRWVWTKTACQTFDCLDFGDNGRNSLVDGACLQRRREEKSLPNVKEHWRVGACTCSCTASGQISFGDTHREPGLCQQGGIPTLCLIRTLVVLVVLAAEQVLLCPCLQRLEALASKS